MDDDKLLDPTPISDDLIPRRPTAYEMLMRQSRKMGNFATRTYDVTKEFLKQDVSALHPDSLLFGQAARPKPVDNNGGELPKRNHNGKTLDPRESLRSIVAASHQLLAGAKTVILPINLFPDSVTVDRTKVTITKRTFFWSSNVISIRIEDVLNVSCSTGPLFGSLIVSSRVMNSTDHYEIDYFWRKDAIYLKQIIQGYVIAQHNKIDTSHLSREELIKTLLEIGQDTDMPSR
ncbi:hypothetical protein RAAC3_TM7C00001G0746 [Candidatus Saccharibacteria bacterium RAAC3_TM7_1]|nr:hypothetical protein RAAC3_TM7C00001G0746 [Candidatus Saccharibacteria bacterium RAAC3_TM7_1]HCZ28547.1 hypothetical protein [Candidatus Saccharibacteria bacterium]